MKFKQILKEIKRGKRGWGMIDFAYIKNYNYKTDEDADKYPDEVIKIIRDNKNENWHLMSGEFPVKRNKYIEALLAGYSHKDVILYAYNKKKLKIK